MKKKKILFALSLLLIIVIPVTIIFGNISGSSILRKLSGAVTTDPGYTYNKVKKTTSFVFGKSKLPYFRVASASDSAHLESSSWYFHEATKGGKYYSGYCLHISLKANERYEGDLTAYTFDDNFSGEYIKNKYGVGLNDHQIQLLQALLASGYHFDEQNSRSIENMSVEEAQKMAAMQILVWEIVESGRTQFTSYAPDYNPSDTSAYSVVVTQNDNVFAYYKSFVDAARDYLNKKDSAGDSPIFGQTYTMKWNSNEKRFTTGAKTGLGNFTSCTSSNADVGVSVDAVNKTVTVYTTKTNQSATITCKLVTGNGSNKWTYYKFVNLPSCANNWQDCWQDIVNGTAGTTITRTFNVVSEGSSVKVIKLASGGGPLSGAVFDLVTPGGKRIYLDGNGAASTITQSGRYLLEEYTVPAGYDRVPATILEFDLSNHTVSCNNGRVENGSVICQGGKISIKYVNNTFEITAYDTLKPLLINKVDPQDNAITGAQFKMYTGNNYSTQVNFVSFQNGFGCGYAYATSGVGLTDTLSGVECSTYSISKLPEGKYKIVEISVPSPYVMPTSEADRTIYIYVDKDSNIHTCTDSTCNSRILTDQNSIKAVNHTTTVSVKKIGNGGNSLPGVKFVLFNSDKTKYIKSTQTGGVYKYNSIVNSLSDATVYVTGSNGMFTVNGLPTGTYYFKEIETVPPYVLPEGDDAFTKVTITMTKAGQKVTIDDGKENMSLIQITNATKVFNFYKVDENGNYLAGGKFKLQKYNADKAKYEDIKVKSVANDGTYPAEADIFKEDANGKVQFTLSHGIATFIDMAANSTYRVVELEAPKGFELTGIENAAVIKIDANGYAKGSATIINQKRSLEGSTAQVELIIEIQTGQTVIRYGLIITGVLIAITGLMGALIFISKKRK